MRFRNIIKTVLMIAGIELVAFIAIAADDAATYLILNDIPPYYRLTKTRDIITDQPKAIPGYTIHGGPGILSGANHFIFDHTDMAYRTEYQSDALEMGMAVEVTQHSGSDSDKWLLHEVEDGYRDGDDSDGKLGLLSGAGVKIRDIGGNRYIYWGLGGGNYTWISGQKVVEIKYTDLQRTKPEPIAVIQAYLQKHPSTISSTFVLDKVHDAQWIKDEMDRRLWLCDKWYAHLAAGKTDQKTAFESVIKSLNVFLDYREKYNGINATDEKVLLAGYLAQNNGAAIQNKLTEYKSWWSAHKTDSISLP